MKKFQTNLWLKGRSITCLFFIFILELFCKLKDFFFHKFNYFMYKQYIKKITKNVLGKRGWMAHGFVGNWAYTKYFIQFSLSFHLNKDVKRNARLLFIESATNKKKKMFKQRF